MSWRYELTARTTALATVLVLDVRVLRAETLLLPDVAAKRRP